MIEAIHICEVVPYSAQEKCPKLTTLLIKAPQEITTEEDICDKALREFTGFVIPATALPDVRIDGTPIADSGLIACAWRYFPVRAGRIRGIRGLVVRVGRCGHGRVGDALHGGTAMRYGNYRGTSGFLR
jgi:hypothetical protein